MAALWWIRRDLRLHDNPALQAALGHGAVLPVFVLDPALAGQSARRQAFLWGGLRALDAGLRQRGSRLVVRRGEPAAVLRELLAETGAAAIHAEEDYTPYARSRDAAVARSLPLELVQGQTVHHPLAVLKPDGRPYTVYTPFSRAWKALLPERLALLPAPGRIPSAQAEPGVELPEVSGEALFPAGEEEALRRLERFAASPIQHYAETRNRPGLDGTACLSPYLRFGMLSMRQAAAAGLAAMQAAPDGAARQSAETWLNELIWREFYIGILYHFPHVRHTAFNASLAKIPWRNEAGEFEAWKSGQTGVPLVDAAMRQLLATGWMHNRARMLAASFLVKDLLVDWRRGERWFMEQLLDGDPAANNGGWQWTAGTGTDAAPYFRIFNPVLQSVKFDPHGDYIRRWVPELAHLAEDVIHAPWEKGIKAPGYPEKPLVEHARARAQALAAYQVSRLAHQKGSTA